MFMMFSIFRLQVLRHPANGPDSGARLLGFEMVLERAEAGREFFFATFKRDAAWL
jgi:hypothetical protein